MSAYDLGTLEQRSGLEEGGGYLVVGNVADPAGDVVLDGAFLGKVAVERWLRMVCGGGDGGATWALQ